jgi:lipid-A-disaccharide synthase
MNREIFFLAGEPSGDARGAELIRALRGLDPSLSFTGMGGPQMKAEGMDVLEDLSGLAVVGIIEVLKHYRFFRQIMASLLREVSQRKPVAVVGIDYPGFNLRFFNQLRSHIDTKTIRRIQYISPQLWAWDEKRKWQMAKSLDLVLCMFPFEPKVYEKTGLRAVYVGHPLISISPTPAVNRDSNLIAFFPGSRERELREHMPVFVETEKLLRQQDPKIQCEYASNHPRNQYWIQSFSTELKIAAPSELFARAHCAAVCSGTATLEAALHGLPLCVIYRVAWPTYWFGRLMIKVPFLGMPNLILNRPLFRELIQRELHPVQLSQELLRLHTDSAARKTLEEGYAQIRSILGTELAAEKAAQEILGLVNRTT